MQSSSQEEEFKLPRRSRSDPMPQIGAAHQVPGPLPAAGSHRDNDDDADDEQLWDPSRATPAVWQWLDSLPCLENAMLALQALHATSYNVLAAERWLQHHRKTRNSSSNHHHRRRRLDDVDHSMDARIFDEMFLGSGCLEKKQFGKIARHLLFAFGQSVLLTKS